MVFRIGSFFVGCFLLRRFVLPFFSHKSMNAWEIFRRLFIGDLINCLCRLKLTSISAKFQFYFTFSYHFATDRFVEKCHRRIPFFFVHSFVFISTNNDRSERYWRYAENAMIDSQRNWMNGTNTCSSTQRWPHDDSVFVFFSFSLFCRDAYGMCPHILERPLKINSMNCELNEMSNSRIASYGLFSHFPFSFVFFLTKNISFSLFLAWVSFVF